MSNDYKENPLNLKYPGTLITPASFAIIWNFCWQW